MPPTKSLSDLQDKMEELEQLYPLYCKRRVLGKDSNNDKIYYLDVTAGVDTNDLTVAQVTVANGRKGVLLIGAQHGDEQPSSIALVEAVEQLLTLVSTTVTAESNAIAKYGATLPAMQPWYNTSSVIDTGLTNAMTNGEIRHLLTKVHLFVVPVVNQAGFDNDGHLASGVNLNRNWPVLWNGEVRPGIKYFASTPDRFHLDNVGAAAASQAETRALMALMQKRITAFIDFHTGYPLQIAYSWGFWWNGKTDRTQRYCNPGFPTALPKPPGQPTSMGSPEPATPPTTGYVEYNPSSATLDALGIQLMQWLITDGAKLPGPFQGVLQAGNPTSAASPWTWTFDANGGNAFDYFFSLDVCHNLSYYIELGSDPQTGSDSKGKPIDASKNVLVIMFSLFKWLLDNFAAPDRNTAVTSDWANTNSGAC